MELPLELSKQIDDQGWLMLFDGAQFLRSSESLTQSAPFKEPKGEFDRRVIGTIAGDRPGANVTKAAHEHMIENKSTGPLRQMVGLGHIHVRQPEPGSLGKQKVRLLPVMGVEITRPYDWPAMVCDFFADRSQLAPERF